MTHSDGNTTPCSEVSSPISTSFNHRRPSCPEEKQIEEDEVFQGRIFWLPPKHELPPKAVRRAHGKGAVEEGIFNHPVVIISRPVDEENIVHFHLITSFQGKKLHEIYGKANEFHASRRSWYLPIHPTPEHPDANSKKSKKRFPTLELAEGATLRWDSYVNLRHVYKIEWTSLRPYSNPETPWNLRYRFGRDSMIRMLAKGKLLTTYEAGSQLQRQAFQELRIPPTPTRIADEVSEESPFLEPDSAAATPLIEEPPVLQDFYNSKPNVYVIAERPPRAPPDEDASRGSVTLVQYIFRYVLQWPWAVVRRLWAWLLP